VRILQLFFYLLYLFCVLFFYFIYLLSIDTSNFGNAPEGAILFQWKLDKNPGCVKCVSLPVSELSACNCLSPQELDCVLKEITEEFRRVTPSKLLAWAFFFSITLTNATLLISKQVPFVNDQPRVVMLPTIFLSLATVRVYLWLVSRGNRKMSEFVRTVNTKFHCRGHASNTHKLLSHPAYRARSIYYSREMSTLRFAHPSTAGVAFGYTTVYNSSHCSFGESRHFQL
jgi:hypothetical protein